MTFSKVFRTEFRSSFAMFRVGFKHSSGTFTLGTNNSSHLVSIKLGAIERLRFSACRNVNPQLLRNSKFTTHLSPMKLIHQFYLYKEMLAFILGYNWIKTYQNALTHSVKRNDLFFSVKRARERRGTLSQRCR